MNPMSNEDFASQLAQFTSLQELQSMGDTLDRSLEANMLLTQTFNNTMSTSLIGRTIKADVNSISIGESGARNITYDLAAPASEVTLEISDESGNVVRTIKASQQAMGEHRLTWDGLDSFGEHVPAGEYSVAVRAAGPDGAPVGASTTVQGRVTGVQYENGNVVLLLGELRVNLGQVISIIDPATTGGGKA